MELVLTVFEPFQADGETWRCGFAFGPSEVAPILKQNEAVGQYLRARRALEVDPDT
jgi:hypothetical protein